MSKSTSKPADDAKNTRAPPLTEPERLKLLELFEIQKDMFSGQGGKLVTMQQKNEVWQKIADLMNEMCTVKREADQISKMLRKFEIQVPRCDPTKTRVKRGGPPASPWNDEEAKIFNILGLENPTISGEPTGIDSFQPHKINIPLSMMPCSSRDSIDEQFQEEEKQHFKCSTLKRLLKNAKLPLLKRQKIDDRERLAQEALDLQRKSQTEQSSFMSTMVDLAQTAKTHLQYKSLKIQFEMQKMLNDNPGLEPCQLIFQNQ